MGGSEEGVMGGQERAERRWKWREGWGRQGEKKR